MSDQQDLSKQVPFHPLNSPLPNFDIMLGSSLKPPGAALNLGQSPSLPGQQPSQPPFAMPSFPPPPGVTPTTGPPFQPPKGPPFNIGNMPPPPAGIFNPIGTPQIPSQNTFNPIGPSSSGNINIQSGPPQMVPPPFPSIVSFGPGGQQTTNLPYNYSLPIKQTIQIQDDKEIQQLKSNLQDKEGVIQNLKTEMDELSRKVKKIENEKETLNQQWLQANEQIQNLQKELINKQILKHDQIQVTQFENAKKQLEEQLSQKEEELEIQKRQVWEHKRLNQSQQDEIQNLNQKLDSQRKIIESQNRQIDNLRKAQGSTQLNSLLQYQYEPQDDQQLIQLNSEIVDLKALNDQLLKKIKDIEADRQDQFDSHQKTTKQLSDTRASLREAQNYNGQLQLQINNLKQHIENQKFQLNQIIHRIDDQKIKEEQLAQFNQMNALIQSNTQAFKAQQEEELLQQENQQQKLRQLQQQEKDKQIALNLEGLEKRKAVMKKVGKIQCLYITDFPKNDDKCQQNIIKSVKQCCFIIKEKTGRDSFWGAITYGAKYPGTTTQQFNQNAECVESFLNGQKKLKVDFEDKPEDLKQALSDASKMKWTEKIKLAIILSTSPCHGKQYHDLSKYKRWWWFTDKKYDTKPNDNIEPVIINLIQSNVVLLGIRYSKDTEVMYNELSKIYQRQKRPDLFFTLEIKDMKNKGYEIAQKITEMAEHLIGTNIQTTKTVVNQVQRQANFEPAIQDMKEIKMDVVQQVDEFQKEAKGKDLDKYDLPEISTDKAKNDQIQYEEDAKRLNECKDGALEALCRRGEFLNFEQKVKTVEFSCNALRVELKNGVFESKKEKIYDIQFEDFDCHKENTWTCIRTEKPFAFGMMKEVYIMKRRLAQDELYVVKVPFKNGPYQTIQDAIKDCRSHLISKTLMNEFMNKLKQAPENNGYPQIIYTDFLILEELEKPNNLKGQYWLAEKFFKGEFKKYNNNDGYICDQDTPLNKIAQAFSYYTYQASGFNYIINDIQGVGNYFTDPAINTTDGIFQVNSLGKFDETDGGEEGIGNFLTTLQTKANLCSSLLKSIGIEMD